MSFAPGWRGTAEHDKEQAITQTERSELKTEIRNLQNTVNDIKVLLERKQDRK